MLAHERLAGSSLHIALSRRRMHVLFSSQSLSCVFFAVLHPTRGFSHAYFQLSRGASSWP